jgi:hypothetical protein
MCTESKNVLVVARLAGGLTELVGDSHVFVVFAARRSAAQGLGCARRRAVPWTSGRARVAPCVVADDVWALPDALVAYDRRNWTHSLVADIVNELHLCVGVLDPRRCGFQIKDHEQTRLYKLTFNYDLCTIPSNKNQFLS